MGKKHLRILVIGAHPDDCELLTGGIAIKYRSLGHSVKYVSATNGNAGHQSLRGDELAAVRHAEFNKSCSITGIECEILDSPDGRLEANLQNRERLIRLIRSYKPDMVFTHRPNDYHPDHRNTSVLVQDSSFSVMVPALCDDTPALDYAPVILYMFDYFKTPTQFRPDIVADIDDVIDTKVKMLDCHKSQFYEWLPWIDHYTDTVPAGSMERIQWLKNSQLKRDSNIADSVRPKLIERYGNERGSRVKLAEAFEISEYGGSLSPEMIDTYFPF